MRPVSLGADRKLGFALLGKRAYTEVMLEEANVATRLPAQDLERARKFYSERLGLEPIEERPGGLLYRCGRGSFALFTSAGAPSGTHTQMAFEVADRGATVAALRARGVVFEEYDLPGFKTVAGIADIAGNYLSKGVGETRATRRAQRAVRSRHRDGAGGPEPSPGAARVPARRADAHAPVRERVR